MNGTNDAFMQRLLEDQSVMADDVRVTLNYTVNDEAFHAAAEIIQLSRLDGGLSIKAAFNPGQMAQGRAESIKIISANITAMGETISHVNEERGEVISAEDKVLGYTISYVKD